MKTILILDNVNPTTTVYKPVTYTDFIDESDNVNLILLTNKNAPSPKDREKCLAIIELHNPLKNGMLELLAKRMHEKHPIHQIYTKQEEIILRAAHLRQLLGAKDGLYRQDALLFRDKAAMKKFVSDKGYPVPAFSRVFSPVDIIAMRELHGFPLVVKSTLGAASAGIRVIKDDADMERYFENEFYELLDTRGRLAEHSGDLIVEAFVKGRMYHVNGYARQGKIVHVWPFAYVHTNLGFTLGKAYGNVSIPTTDKRHSQLLEATQKLLSILPCPDNLIFHVELFESETGFALCEIAARRPGGSIALLIDLIEGGRGIFPEIEFRLNNGLQLREHGLKRLDSSKIVADLMIPKQIGTLIKLPDPQKCPVPHVECTIFAKLGSSYSGFDIGQLNSCARLVIQQGYAGVEETENALNKANEWFNSEVAYSDFDSQKNSSIGGSKL